MRRAAPIVLTALLLVGCETAELLPEPSIELRPRSSTIEIGDKGTITIDLFDLEEDVFAVTMRIKFDTSFVSYYDTTGFRSGDFFGSDALKLVEPRGDTLYVSITRVRGDDPVRGEGTVGLFELKGEESGRSDILLLTDYLRFYDLNGKRIQLTDLQIKNANIVVR